MDILLSNRIDSCSTTGDRSLSSLTAFTLTLENEIPSVAGLCSTISSKIVLLATVRIERLDNRGEFLSFIQTEKDDEPIEMNSLFGCRVMETYVNTAIRSLIFFCQIDTQTLQQEN